MARGQQKRAWQVATFLFGANVAIAAQLRNDLLKKPSKEKHRDRWTTNFGELRQWLQQHENVYPERGTQKGNKLEKWVRRQRVAFREDKLSEQKQLLLESLPAWTWGGWYSKFHALQTWLALQPEPRRYPRRTAESQVERLLARWVNAQRRSFRFGSLSEQRPSKLMTLAA